MVGPRGWFVLLDTVEAELRQLAADEMSRDLAKEDDSSIAAKGIRARTREVQARIRAPRERARTRLEERAAQSKDREVLVPKTQAPLTSGRGLKMAATGRIAPFPTTKNTSLSPKLQQHLTPQHWLEQMMRKDTGAKPKAKAKASAVTSMVMIAQSNPASDFNPSSRDEDSSDLEALLNAGTVASTDSTRGSA